MKTKSWIKASLIVCFAVLAMASSGYATTIDFNELAHNDFYHPVNPVNSDGYTFNNSCGHGSDCLGVWGKNSPFQSDPGFASVFVNYGGTITTMTQNGGGSFDLFSIDLADVYNNGTSVTILFTFNH